MDDGSITEEADRLVDRGVKSIEGHDAEVSAGYLEILRARQHAARVIRRTSWRTFRSGNVFAATTWRRMLSTKLHRVHCQQRIDAIKRPTARRSSSLRRVARD